jgi:ubiquitin C-terminal hydrolase
MNAGNKGLANLGNTCYMNAALQCLSHLLEFHPQNKEFRKNKDIGDDLFKQWYDLQKELWNNESESIVVPKQFLTSFIRSCRNKDILFYNFNQNDTEEFISIFMDLLHQSIRVSAEITINGEPTNKLQQIQVNCVKSWAKFFNKDYSYIIKKFYSQLVSITACTNCNHVAFNYDPYMVLSLEITDTTDSLYDCLSEYTSKFSLDSGNTWKCDKCNKHVCPDKKLYLWKTSDVLIILLKRYSKQGKKNNFIEFPIHLDLDQHVVDYNNYGKDYKLSGLCIQDGSLNGGHYYAMCYNELDKQWRKYNDTYVSDVDESVLLKQKPYCLFYRRV